MSATTPKPIRSPSYPASPLSEAIGQVRKIESGYRLSPVDRVAAAKLVGYSGLSGPANAALAALAQYGLVERAGKGEMRVTSLAQSILHPDSEDEKRRGLWTAALEPQLFRELHERWPNMIPPEDGVVTYLNRKGFNQSAIRPAAKAYLETLRFLEEAGATESHGMQADPVAESPPEPMEAPVIQTPSNAPAAAAPPPPASDQGAALNKINFNIQGDRVYVSGLLNAKGILALEKKLASLKLLLESDSDVEEEDDQTAH